MINVTLYFRTGALLAIQSMFAPYHAVAHELVCSTSDAFAAEEESGYLSDWEAVFRSYQRFRACHDGAISEGYSDSISQILADDWETFDDLAALAKRSRGFEDFVVRHLDETVGYWTAHQIRTNLERCPRSATRLCTRLANAVTDPPNPPSR